MSTEDDRIGNFLLGLLFWLVGGSIALMLGLGLNALGFAVLPVEPNIGQVVSFYLFWPLFLIKFMAFYLYWVFANLVLLLTF